MQKGKKGRKLVVCAVILLLTIISFNPTFFDNVKQFIRNARNIRIDYIYPKNVMNLEV